MSAYTNMTNAMRNAYKNNAHNTGDLDLTDSVVAALFQYEDYRMDTEPLYKLGTLDSIAETDNIIRRAALRVSNGSEQFANWVGELLED